MLISQDQIVINFKWDSVVAIPLSGISSSTVSKPKLFEICCCQSSCCLQSSNIWPRKQFEGVFATILLPCSCRCYACVLVEINDISATLVDMESVLQKLWQFPQRNFWSSWTQQAQSSSISIPKAQNMQRWNLSSISLYKFEKHYEVLC